MNVMRKLSKLLMKPEKFFHKVDHEEYMPALFLFAGINAMLLVLAAIVTLIALPIMGVTGDEILGMSLIGLLILVLGIGFSFITPWITAAFLHIGAWLMDGTGEYLGTFKSATYAYIIRLFYAVPLAIFYICWVVGLQENLALGPVAMGLFAITSFAALIHSVYVLTMGFKVLHKLSTGKAFVAAFIIPAAIAFVFYIVLYFTIIATILGAVTLAA
ncbi:MAG: YIP1 family protein [Candidatus Nanoarchaeia archaeon]